MDANRDSNAGEEDSSATLSSEEFESWTLVDRSPKAGNSKMKPGQIQRTEQSDKEKVEDAEAEEESDEDVDDDEEEEEEKESGSSNEGDIEAEEDTRDKPSGVEPVKNKTKQTKYESDADVARDKGDDVGRPDERESSKKKLAGSNVSLHSHDGSSSDGISVISDSDGGDHARLHFNRHLNLDQLQQSSVQLTPPLSPEQDTEKKSNRNKQLKRKRIHDDAETALVPENSIVPWKHVGQTSFIIFSIILTGIAAVMIGNSRIYENRANIDNFDHEQRLSELELENTILRNEMNKLKHLYTRSELDEQVQQAEFEWIQTMDQQMDDQFPTEPEPQPEPEPPTSEPEQPQVRRVPPQDENVRHKVVWSGDDGQPMLIADQDYVLPEFCYNKDAVQDELFSEYSAKYCDTKQRKIEAKLKKAEHYENKHKKHKHPRDYKQYIHPTAEEVAEHQKQSTAPPPKIPSLSPFEFDYAGAFESIKEEGSVILQGLSAILDLDPEPELILSTVSEGYLADDEVSSSSSSTSTGSAGTTAPPNVGPTATEAIIWADYPTWVREKYETQPDMHWKLKNKASLLWEWERKKNQFLDEVGLTTLEEIDRKTEDELRQRREQYERERKGRQPGEFGGEQTYDNNRDHRGKGEKYDERKDYRPRNGDDRSHEHRDYHHKEHHKEWNSKERQNGDKNPDYNRQADNERPSSIA